MKDLILRCSSFSPPILLSNRETATATATTTNERKRLARAAKIDTFQEAKKDKVREPNRERQGTHGCVT